MYPANCHESSQWDGMYTRLAYSRTYLPMSMRLPIQRKEPAAFRVREGYTTRACAVLYKAENCACSTGACQKHLELISYYTKKIFFQRAPRSVATAKERANYPSLYRWYYGGTYAYTKGACPLSARFLVKRLPLGVLKAYEPRLMIDLYTYCEQVTKTMRQLLLLLTGKIISSLTTASYHYLVVSIQSFTSSSAKQHSLRRSTAVR